jgi:hypothetical protein
MALGHIVLPGVGTAIAVGVAAVLSYREVNQLQEALKELERANRNNLAVMRGISEARTKYAEGEQKLTKEVASLSAAVRVAHRRLRRFRLLSDLIRRIRFHLLGHYYTAADMEHVVELERAVDGFMAAFSRRRYARVTVRQLGAMRHDSYESCCNFGAGPRPYAGRAGQRKAGLLTPFPCARSCQVLGTPTYYDRPRNAPSRPVTSPSKLARPSPSCGTNTPNWPGIRDRQRLGPCGDTIAGQNLDTFRARQHVWVGPRL